MILVDFNNVVYSTVSHQLGKEEVSVDLLRHMTLNCLRSYRAKHSQKYGELVLVSDSRENWRKEMFPYYKARRKMAREESHIDWTKVFGTIDVIKQELIEVFPYKFLEIDRAEADDIIASLVFKFSLHEKVLIMSADTDFVQLHINDNVQQYDPVRKKYIKTDDWYKYLREHILEGDGDDDVPNFRSPDNCFVQKIRQKPVSQKLKDKLLAFPNADVMLENSLINAEEHRNIKRNEQLIDLRKAPEDIRINILEEYERQDAAPKNRSKLFNYFVKHKLKHLLPSIQEF